MCTLGVWAQKADVKFEGTAPNILDFALWYFTRSDGDPENTPDVWEEGVRNSLQCYQTGDEQPQGFKITVDMKAGYILVEQTDEDGYYTHRYEMCYWNMADQKHKLFALNIELWQEGMRLNPGQYDCLMFWRYDNATKRMTPVEMGIKMEYFNTSYGLPRVGKDITVTKWNEATGNKTKRTLKWNGRGFSK